MKNIVLLVGGVGGAKLAYGLAQVVPPGSLTIIVNTGDDFWHYGLRICPDLDTVMYTLAGVVNQQFGWGVADDTQNMLHMMRHYGEANWFGLGDKDIATHLLRTQWWHENQRLTDITQRLSTNLGVRHTLLPMTDSPVATRVTTVEHGEMGFQEYFVRERWQPVVKSLHYDGVEYATMNSEVRAAIDEADAIVIGPSNPWLSIAPIVSVPGLRESIAAREIPRVAVTPIIRGEAVKGPAAKLMVELGYEQSAQAVADYYSDLINGFVYDSADDAISLQTGRTTALDTIMHDHEDRVRLAKEILGWIGE